MELSYLAKKPFYLNEEEIGQVSYTLSSMTDEEKCGQIFVALGNAYDEDDLYDLIENYGIGGVLFRPGASEQVRQQYKDADAHARIPLLKAANLEEGGAGVITDGTYFGSEMQVAAANDLSCTEAFAECCAKEGRAVGVNWTFSPVVDIDLNFMNPITNTRTFGSDPCRVLENAKTFVKTIQQYGVAASCKHFPGDGHDYRDQHLHPTYNNLTADEWYGSYGRIYKELIDEGLMSVMVGHIVQPAVIKDINPGAAENDMLPGSQSKELMTGVLRDKYGFNGLIITDATIMGGYTMTMERQTAIPCSIAAGADMICFSTDIREDIGYVREALRNGRLDPARLDEAVSRILALKAVLSRTYPEPVTAPDVEAKRCAEQAITLVKNKSHLPISLHDTPEVRIVLLGSDKLYDGSLTEEVRDYLTSKGFDAYVYDPYEDDLHGTGGLSASRLTLMLCNYQPASNQTTVRVKWCDKHALEIPRFVKEEPYACISFGNPYHLQDIPRVPIYINAYSATKASVKAALSCLIGEAEFKGISPVDAYCSLLDARL